MFADHSENGALAGAPIAQNNETFAVAQVAELWRFYKIAAKGVVSLSGKRTEVDLIEKSGQGW